MDDERPPVADQPSDAQDSFRPVEALRALLDALGYDPGVAGLQRTPERVWRAWRALTDGEGQGAAGILRTRFPQKEYDEMIVVRRIPFWSLCEHHMMPFHGHATVGYLPNGGYVVGLSKIARLVRMYSRRLQIQERMTEQIPSAIMKHLEASGAGCVIEAHHTCMEARGVETPGAMVTSCLLGCFQDPNPRSEFLALARQ